MVAYALLFVVAAATSALLSPVLARVGLRVGIVDEPGERKIHLTPMPRLGGVAVALALALALGVSQILEVQALVPATPDPRSLLPIITGAMLVFAVGLWDDIDSVSPFAKLGVEAVAALIIVGAGLAVTRFTLAGTTYDLGWLAAPLTMVWILVVTNAFNLLDGLDGLAAGLAAIAAITCAVVLVVRGEQAGALLLVSLAGAIAGFLAYNFHPARIFLGDSGSLLAGFLLAVTAITGQQKGATTLAVGVPLLIFLLPLADTTFTVVRRFVAGQRHSGVSVGTRLHGLSGVFTADRRHLHHRLMDRGLSQRRTVLLLYALAIACSTVALITMQVP